VYVQVSGQRDGNMKNPRSFRWEKRWANELLAWRGKGNPEEQQLIHT